MWRMSHNSSYNFKMSPTLLLISICLLSGLSHGRKEVSETQDDLPQKKETSLDELHGAADKFSQDCCGSLYEIGQDVGALTEALRNTISRLDETIRREEETTRSLEKTIRRQEETSRRLEVSEAQLAALNDTLSTVLNKEKIQVAFTASFPLDGSQTAGTSEAPIVYRNVETNLGNAYSPLTGFFTAPVKGVYSFSFTSFFWGDSSRTSGGSLYHNRRRVVSWYHNTGVNHPASGTNSAVLMLNAGDKVNVYLWARRTISDNGNKYSSFSGFLLYTL